MTNEKRKELAKVVGYICATSSKTVTLCLCVAAIARQGRFERVTLAENIAIAVVTGVIGARLLLDERSSIEIGTWVCASGIIGWTLWSMYWGKVGDSLTGVVLAFALVTTRRLLLGRMRAVEVEGGDP